MIELYFELSYTDELCRLVSSVFQILNLFYKNTPTRKKIYITDVNIKFNSVLKDDGAVDFVFAIMKIECLKKKEQKIIKEIRPIFHQHYDLYPSRFKYRISIIDEASASES